MIEQNIMQKIEEEKRINEELTRQEIQQEVYWQKKQRKLEVELELYRAENLQPKYSKTETDGEIEDSYNRVLLAMEREKRLEKERIEEKLRRKPDMAKTPENEIELRNMVMKKNWEKKHQNILMNTKSSIRQDPISGAYHAVDPETVALLRP